MYRILSIVALLGVGLTANAGQIQIGGASGLTTSYITSNGGSLGVFQERNYTARLYPTIPNAPVYTTGAYSPLNGQGAPDETIVAPVNGVTFSMINDGCSGAVPSCLTNNFWDGIGASTPGANSLIIPIGLQNVSSVWTLLNDVWGSPSTVSGQTVTPVSQTKVTFNFGTSANDLTYDHVVRVNLENALGSLGSPYGQVRAGINCTSESGPGSNCDNFARGPLAASSSVVSVIDGNIGSTTVLTETVSSVAYSSGGTGQYANSAGNVVLDAQGFQFGNTYFGLYLVSIQISNPSGLANVSNSALSAITVNTDAVPEPSAIWLMLSGVGAIGLSRWRRNRKQ